MHMHSQARKQRLKMRTRMKMRTLTLQTRRWAVAPLAAEAPPGAARAAPNFAATAGGRKMLPESEVGAGGGTWWIGGERVPWWPIG
eukprot:COSAG03_NODE_47_length_16579_cov_37.123665_4_plen_86_part_00